MKRCPDCKHTKGIGYDFWCGEGHDEYAVFGAETNCPYYEYHDWSKGTPCKNEKRFTDDCIEEKLEYYQRQTHQLKKRRDDAIDKIEFLNGYIKELHQEINSLKFENAILQERSNIRKFEMMNKEVTVDLNGLDINIQKEIIFKSDLNKWIEKKINYYGGMMEKTDGFNKVNAEGHLEMLIVLKEWIKQRR